FKAEQRILSRLEHRNVARLYEAGIDESGSPYFVMEYVDGLPIDQYANERRLSVEGRIALIRQLTEALSYAHRNLIVHRDVKPSNILVTAEGDLKLLDFGVAKLLDAEAPGATGPLTRHGAPALTPEYASPEQIRGEPVTTAADVYATGVLLYELLTGLRPYEFTSRSPVHIEKVISEQEPRRPSTAVTGVGAEAAQTRDSTPARLARSLTGDLDWIILKSLRKEPAARYGTVQQLADDLDRYLQNQPVEARPPSFRYQAGKFVSRNRTPLAVASLLVLSLVGGLGATAWQANRATRAAEQADRVKELVVGLFQASDPDEAQGATLTAVDLLQRGEQTLLDGLEDEPQVRAELMHIVGGLYTSLGEYDRATPLLETSLAVREEIGDKEGTASTLATLADLLDQKGEYDEGEQMARRRLALRRELNPSRSTEVGSALSDLAVFLSFKGEYDEAEELLLEALAIDQEAERPDLEASDWNSLSILRARRGDYDAAIEAGEMGLAARLREGDEDNTGLATNLMNLGWALDNKGEWERADSMYMATLEMRRRILGDEHPHVAVVLNNLASMRQKEGRLAESRELHMESLALRRKIFGNDHADVAASLNNLGIVSYFESNYEEAEIAFVEALRVFRLHRAEDHPHVLTGVGNLAAVYREQGKLDESEALFREAVETRIRVLGPDHEQAGGAWNNLGFVLFRQGDPVEAESAHREAIRVFATVFSPDHPDLAGARVGLGGSLIEQSRGAEAVEVLDLACPALEGQLGEDHRRSAMCRGKRGLALLIDGQTEEGHQALSKATSIAEAELPEDPWTLRFRAALDRLPGG
ncbi:MAG: tetratricopeptide repeat protein, partial [Longimicrobiales bacterium]